MQIIISKNNYSYYFLLLLCTQINIYSCDVTLNKNNESFIFRPSYERDSDLTSNRNSNLPFNRDSDFHFSDNNNCSFDINPNDIDVNKDGLIFFNCRNKENENQNDRFEESVLQPSTDNFNGNEEELKTPNEDKTFVKNEVFNENETPNTNELLNLLYSIEEEDSNIKTIYNCGTHNEQKTESIVEKTGYNRHEIGQNKYEDTNKDIRKNIKENVNAEDFLKMNCVTMLTDPKQEKNRECHFRCC